MKRRPGWDVQVGGTHYRDMAIQPTEFITRNSIPFIEGCIIKYACRHGRKDGRKDVEKIIHYAQLLLQLKYPLEGQSHDRRKRTGENRKRTRGHRGQGAHRQPEPAEGDAGSRNVYRAKRRAKRADENPGGRDRATGGPAGGTEARPGKTGKIPRTGPGT